MEEHLNKFEECLQHEVSFCSAACPFNLDVNTFIARLQEGRFNAAYKAYRDATGFPEIASMLCTEECKSSCLRNAVSSVADSQQASEKNAADPIELLKLEKAVLQYASRKDPVNYNVPSKHKSVAIIGAGISGMACALRMATKKYKVTIYEKTDRTGGSLMDKDSKAAERIQTDFALQMKHLDYDIRFNTEIKSLDEIIHLGYADNKAAAETEVSAVAAVMRSRTTNAHQNYEGTYDAIYIATGESGPDFGINTKANNSEYGGPCMLINHVDGTAPTAVFLGGALVGSDPVHALADGLRSSTAIDNYTLTGILKYPVYPETEIQIDDTQYITTKTAASSGEIYSKDEAVAEAMRCMKCQCNACRLHCDLTEYLHKWPLRIKDEIIATTAPGRSELHATPAVRLINSCTHCGLCKETCPSDIDMDGLIQSARVRMHKLDKMPWAFNDFFLRDMAFTNSDAAYLCGTRSTDSSDISSSNSTKYLFFPGCQLGASEPELVIKSYEWLLDKAPNTGIMLGCCGVPAQWAGDEDLHDQVLSRIRSDWEKLGKPIMILACPTCRNTFAQQLPEIETIFLYELMCNGVRSESALMCNGVGSDCTAWAVFDPCATSQGEPVREAVRSICDAMKIRTMPLPVQERWSACCSYGGHGILADPDFTRFVRNNRISESPLPYITYCINCRDSFLHEGKEAAHILNLIFGTEPKLETVTQRRKNRIYLKKTLMKKYLNKSSNDDSENAIRETMSSGDSDTITLVMSDEVRKKLSEEFILEQEAADAVSFCEKTGRTFLNQDKNSYTGYRKIGNLTYWVEYQKIDKHDTFELLNAYTHRMTIELEMIWNGHKVDIHE